MARTKQSTRSSTKKTKAVRLPSTFTTTIKFDNCVDCRVNLSKWGRGNNVDGMLCFPCRDVRLANEAAKRKAQAKVAKLVVRVDVAGNAYESKLPFSKKRGKLQHAPHAHAGHSAHPTYDVYYDTGAAAPENKVAAAMVRRLFTFAHDAPKHCRGTVIFQGYGSDTLLPEEVKRLLQYAGEEKYRVNI